MKVSRRFTTPHVNVYDATTWTHRTSRITNADGSLVFEMQGAEVPASWSQLATDIMVSKYFRKAGVPQTDAHGEIVRNERGETCTGPERSARQVIQRLTGCWRHWGETHGYFDSDDDAQAFEDELAWMLINQVAAPNSPQWFNTGLHWAYGISGPAQGHWVNDPASGRTTLATDAYSHPQPHACFIQSVRDDLVGEGGIMDLWVREARLFKYGSGTGTNFSSLRGEDEPLSGGGRSSGLMSFLRIGDRAAGAIKSGGTTRRAAKMVCLDVDHPDIESFVGWKVREELKVSALVEGFARLPDEQKEIARSLGLVLDYDFNGESYQTVSGQNSNNSVRLSDAFLRAVEQDGQWTLRRRTDGQPARTMRARELWDRICFAAWRCADPGIQFDTTINDWHTCPGSGRINASNPCSEYMFLDDTACNLASINLLKFYDPHTRHFDVEAFEHATELWTMVLEISVLMAAFPSKEIARLSYEYRTLGLGFANLGAMLMQAGIPYDSEEGRAVCGTLSAIMTGRSYATSALLAAEHGPFAGFTRNREAMLRVMRNHRRAALGTPRDREAYEDISVAPVPIDHDLFEAARVPIANADQLLARSVRAWDDALAWGERHGFRNAQVTVIAPTGTIGLLMDCDTTGVEPDFALVKFKKLAGGGYFKIANASLRPALRALGYETEAIDAILRHVTGALNLDVPLPGSSDDAGNPNTFRAFLESCGYEAADLVGLENTLPTVFDLRHAFSAWSIPDHVMKSLGIDIDDARANATFSGLQAMGLSESQINALNRTICGTQTIEGAPGLRDEHLPVFDCANRCGPEGRRFIEPQGHIRMMAAAQPFITGAISKTINLPREASVQDVADAYRLSWELGLKANALYRDGSKLSQPLSVKADVDDDEEDEEGIEAALTEISDSVIRIAEDAGEGQPVEYVERIVERIIERPMRRRLPDTRASLTHRFNVAGHEGYLTVGLYDDGRPGELFITMSKEGSTIGGLMDSLGTAISVALQYGVPVEDLVNKFAHQRFEPMGLTTSPDIPFAKSLVDYIFRWMGMEFIQGYREANAPTRGDALRSPDARTRTVKEDTRRWSSTTDDAPATAPADSSGPQGGERMDSGSTSRPASAVRRTAGAKGSTPSASTSDSSDRRSVTTVGMAGVREITESTDSSLTVMFTSVSRANATMQSDAPACDQCGEITVRNGACYKCVNCGNSLGCS